MLEYSDVIGVDEVGRGPLFGEVVAVCAYIKDINKDRDIFEKINDSKKLSEKKREELYEKIIKSDNILYAVGIASEKEIDEINILNATFLAMNRALEKLDIKDKMVIVDGNKLIKGYNGKQEFLVKADSKNLTVSLASIIAKVYRDNMMKEYAKVYKNYGLENHKGYGTKKHYEAIIKYGITDKHRKSFLKKILEVRDNEV
ncbi:ribonuclease HII [Oceanivirga miroungae]|uniref:Ribonuclease HII n=1 Tax=Oceanivirga miroungae TaxID=1130046 RepID=A0A6I8ME82_9FUSO|nr:ribonuclease HII [Oceanivirga miroungae]VWL85775.1 ribonuclease H [Oceanivirga miroungae]